jgi:hypothetical protein
MSDLERIVEEGVYRAMIETRPSLVASIADLVRSGQTPAQIEARCGRVCVVAGHKQSDLPRLVFHVARHLARNQ